MRNETLDRDASLPTDEQVYAEIQRAPVFLTEGDEHISRFGGNLELRVSHRRRMFTIEDGGWLATAVGRVCACADDYLLFPFWIGLHHWNYLPFDCPRQQDLFDRPPLPPQFDYGFWLKRLSEFLEIRRRQFRTIRNELLAELPDEIGKWIVAMRFPWLTFADIALMWRRMDEARCVARDNINLLPIWCLWQGSEIAAEWGREAADEAAALDSVRSMRAQLRQSGVPQRMWRLLCRHGARLFEQEQWCFEPWERWNGSALPYLRLLAVDDSPRLPSHEEKSVLLTLAVCRGEPLLEYPNLARAVLDQIRACGGEEYCMEQTFGGELIIVLDWLLEMAARNPDANFWGTGWKQWSRSKQQVQIEWQCAIETFESGPYAVVPLCSNRDLAEEGERMENCLSHSWKYANQCYIGNLRIFSIRRASNGESVATVSLELRDAAKPEVGEAEGFRHASVPIEVLPVIDELRRRYQATFEMRQSD